MKKNVKISFFTICLFCISASIFAQSSGGKNTKSNDPKIVCNSCITIPTPHNHKYDECYGPIDTFSFVSSPLIPVCGCDGKSYKDGQIALASGIKSFTLGECGVAPQGDCINQNIREGRVIPRCTAPDIGPVCGCDGVTYQNECAAILSGVNRVTPGRCGQTRTRPDNIVLVDTIGYEISDRSQGLISHLNKITTKSNEVNSSKIDLEFYNCSSGLKKVDSNNSNRVFVSSSLVNKNSKCGERSICFDVTTSFIADQNIYGELKDAVFVLNSKGELLIRSKSGVKLGNGTFEPANSQGESWATITYKGKHYCVKMTSQNGVVDKKGNFFK